MAPDPRLRQYAELVLEKNKLLNLTAAATVEEVLDRHIGDGLAALPWLAEKFPKPIALADVGAGAGFIGIALAIARPDIALTLIESRKGRTEFLEWVCAKLRVKVDVRRERAEDSPKDTFDVVVERALAPLKDSVALCRPLARPGGCFLAWQSEEAGGTLDAVPSQTIRYRLAGEKKDRYILCFER